MGSFPQLLFIALLAFSMPPASGQGVDLKKVFEKEVDFTLGEGDDSFKATVGASIGYIFQLKPAECSYTAMVDPGTLSGTSEAFPFTYGGVSYTFPEQDLSYQAVDSGFHYTSGGGVTLTLTRSLPVGFVLSRVGVSATLELSILFERTHADPCCFSQWKVSMEVKFTVEKSTPFGSIVLLEKSSDPVVVKEDLEIEHLASQACSPMTAAPTITSTTAAPTTAAPPTTSATAAPTTAAPTTAAPTTTSTTAAPMSEIKVCANEGGYCQCTGRVYYGRRFVNGKPGSGQRMTFEQMKMSALKTRDVQDRVWCANPVFSDPLHGYYKQCFCETEAPMTAPTTTSAVTETTAATEGPMSASIKVCANEGQNCQCTGRVYYGRRFVNGKPGSGQRMTLEQMKNVPFKTKDVQQQVSCANPALGDPEHGYYKQCFCEEDARRLQSTVFV